MLLNHEMLSVRPPYLIKKQTGNTQLLFIFVAVIAVIVGLYVQNSRTENTPGLPEFEKTILLPDSRPLSANGFSDHLGRNFGTDQLQGRWSILFFGFTNCPDICPSTMKMLSDIKRKVSDAGYWDNYQVVMVSVDPERDTQEKLGQYVPFFDADFIGIRSDIERTTDFAKQVGVLFVKRESDDKEWYDVDHSASLILINPQGEWAGAITAPHKVDEISNDLIKLAKYAGKAEPVTRQTKPSTKAVLSETAGITRSTSPTIRITNAWIRPAPPNARSMAAYFDLTNHSNKDINIVDSQSSAFAMTMIHDTVIENGMAQMRHLDVLTVPAGSGVALQPMGKHMMLMQPKSPLSLGDSTEIVLITEDGQRITALAEVREPNEETPK